MSLSAPPAPAAAAKLPSRPLPPAWTFRESMPASVEEWQAMQAHFDRCFGFMSEEVDQHFVSLDRILGDMRSQLDSSLANILGRLLPPGVRESRNCTAPEPTPALAPVEGWQAMKFHCDRCFGSMRDEMDQRIESLHRQLSDMRSKVEECRKETSSLIDNTPAHLGRFLHPGVKESRNNPVPAPASAPVEGWQAMQTHFDRCFGSMRDEMSQHFGVVRQRLDNADQRFESLDRQLSDMRSQAEQHHQETSSSLTNIQDVLS